MPLARKALVEALAGSRAVRVMGAVSGPAAAERRWSLDQPEALLLDLQPPVQPAIQQLLALQAAFPVPVLLSTALDGTDRKAVIDALAIPPWAVILKPTTGLVAGTAALVPALEAALCQARSGSGPPRREPPETRRPAGPAPSIIAIGASTGGTEALATIVAALPRGLPGLVIVQHMPAQFTPAFARRLNDLGELDVAEAADGDELRPGLALLAPGALSVVAGRQGLVARVAQGSR